MNQTIVIHGLPADFDADDVFLLCEDFGDVIAVELRPKRGGRSLSVYVEYGSEWEAEMAMAELDGMSLEDGHLRVDFAEQWFSHAG